MLAPRQKTQTGGRLNTSIAFCWREGYPWKLSRPLADPLGSAWQRRKQAE